MVPKYTKIVPNAKRLNVPLMGKKGLRPQARKSPDDTPHNQFKNVMPTLYKLNQEFFFFHFDKTDDVWL